MRLFIDLDGVLADFNRGYQELCGGKDPKMGHAVDWDRIQSVGHFYAKLMPMRGAFELWNYLKIRNPIILSGLPATIATAAADKRTWVDHWLGKNVPLITCASRDKCLHGSSGDVLIDDWEQYKPYWTAMGGHWITYTSNAQAIADFNRYLYSRS